MQSYMCKNKSKIVKKSKFVYGLSAKSIMQIKQISLDWQIYTLLRFLKIVEIDTHYL
jgi:hypothetical protein